MAGKVHIYRGVSGAGKSKHATKYREFTPRHIAYCSADIHRYVDGVYRFDPKDNSPHKKCFANFLEYVSSTNYDEIIIDNTNIQLWEFASYYKIAEHYDWEVEILNFVCNPALAAARTSHNVPSQTIFRMDCSMREHTLLIPPKWKQSTIFSA